MFGSFTVVLREVIRASRRWRTYALRTGWALALAILVAGSYQALEGAEDVAALSELGRTQFIAAVIFQMVLVGLIAPVLVGQGIVEERLDGTLELVAITRLTPARILLGKLLSRLLVLFLVVVGSFPILALQLQFGGVSNSEFVAAAVATTTTVGMMALVGLNVSLFSRGIIAPALAGVFFAIPAFFVIPAVAAIGMDLNDEGLATFSPVFFAFGDADWQPFVVPFLWAPTAAALLWLAIIGFRVKLVEGEPAVDDAAAIAWDRFTWWASASSTIALLTAAVPMVYNRGYAGMLAYGMQVPAWFPRDPTLITAWNAATPYWPDPRLVAAAWVILAFHGGSLLYVQLAGRLLDRVDGLLGASVGSVTIPGLRGARRLVMFEPIVWREALTRGAGAVSWLSIAATLAYLGLIVLVGCGGGLDEGGIRYALGVLGWMTATGGASLLAAATFAEERRARTLELLLLTTIKPWRIVVGKLLTISVQVLPLAAFAGLLIASDWNEDRWDEHEHGVFAEPWFAFAWLPRLLMYAGWSTVWTLAVTTVCLLLAMRLRPASVLLPVVLTVPWIAPILAIVVQLVGNAGRDRPIPMAIVGLLVPFAGDSTWCFKGGVPTEVFLASGAATGVAIVAFLTLCLRLRTWANDDRPEG